MSLRFSASPIVFLLCFLRVHGNDWIQPELFGFEIPELDGYPVDNTCKIVDTGSNTSPTTTRPFTRQRMVIITKKPVVQLSQRKQVIKAPIRTRPTAAGPIRNQDTNQALRILYYLLANSRRRSSSSQPMKGLNVMSSSEESKFTPRHSKNVAFWKIGAVSSEDSSDES